MKFSRSYLYVVVGSSNVNFHSSRDETVQNKFSEKAA